MKNVSKKIVVIIILILALSFMGSATFAFDRSVSVNHSNNVVYLSGPAQMPPRNVTMSPGSLDEYTISITNNTGSNVNLYFIEATEIIAPQQLGYFDLRVYINNNLYIEERVVDVTEEHMYVIAPGETVAVAILIGLSQDAGNEFQGATFTILWTMAITSPIIVEDDEDIDLGIVQGVDRENEGNQGGNRIPQTGQSVIIYYVLYGAIAIVILFIIIILFKRRKEEEEEENDENDGTNE
ncbi:MAG: LPXTG cell wall anchor domain-containing protein [Oscillospiraceae bacterium]|nr:LPXTG cell wall anchor domain-containing protein [Oscillospiraceae bacterium]